MMSVAAMLNPVDDQGLPSPTTTRAATETPEPSPATKKQKLAKDAAVFHKGKPMGPVSYPPFETFSQAERDRMAAFSIYPAVASITSFPRHIPYSSDKKTFLQKTGRDAFEVFQYTFKVPSDERSHTVMWDYQIGLVRITPFFKCCHYAKTIPGKMLAANPGLKDLCHSITGGALAAQGYWMPYQTAKALAATFCHRIRYALLPLFGPDFAQFCVEPGAEGFGRMVIGRTVIERCIGEAATYSRMAPIPSTPTQSPVSSGMSTADPQTTSPSVASVTSPARPLFREPRYNVPRRAKAAVGDVFDHSHHHWTTDSKRSPGRRNGMAGNNASLLASPQSDTDSQASYKPPRFRRSGGRQRGLGITIDTSVASKCIPRSYPVQARENNVALASRALLAACTDAEDYEASDGNNDGVDDDDDDGDDSNVSPKTTVKPRAALLGHPTAPELRQRKNDCQERRVGHDADMVQQAATAAADVAAATNEAHREQTDLEQADLEQADLEQIKAAWMLCQLSMANARQADQPHPSSRSRKRRASH